MNRVGIFIYILNKMKKLLFFLLPILFSCADEIEESFPSLPNSLAICPYCEPDLELDNEGTINAELNNGVLRISFEDQSINQFIPREYSASPYQEPVHYKDYGGSFVYFELRKQGHTTSYTPRDTNYSWLWNNQAISNSNYYLLSAYYKGDYHFGDDVFGLNFYTNNLNTNAENILWGALFNTTLPQQTNNLTQGYIEFQVNAWPNQISPLTSGELTKANWVSYATSSGPSPSQNYDDFKYNGLSDGIYEALFFVEFHQKGGDIGINIISAYQRPVSIRFQILNGNLIVLNSSEINAPTNLQSPAQTENSISLTWNDNSSNETGFRVMHNSTTLVTVAPNATSTTITGLQSATSYQLTLQAFNASESANSNTISVATSDPIVIPVTVNISGPVSLPFGGTGSYTANTTGSVSSIEWHIRYYDETSFTLLSNYSGMTSFGSWFTKSFDLKCVVNGVSEDTYEVFVQSKGGGGLGRP